MPLFAAFLGGVLSRMLGFFVAAFGAKYGVRIAAAVALGTGYVACVAYWSTLISPWLSGVFTTAYGALLGLLFPPVAGSVLAGLATFWTCVAVQKYTSTLINMVKG